MTSDACFCMAKTPERGEQTPGKEGIEEETDTQEKTIKENDTIGLWDVQSDNRDTPEKETQENDEEDGYLPTPPEDPEQDNRYNTQEAKVNERDEDAMKSITSEQSERAPKTAQSEVGQKEVGDSEEERKEESVEPETEKSRRKRRGRTSEEIEIRSEYTPIRRSSHDPIKNQQHLNMPGKGKSTQIRRSSQTSYRTYHYHHQRYQSPRR